MENDWIKSQMMTLRAHPATNLLKSITDPKFDILEFAVTGMGQFWSQLLAYMLSSNNKKGDGLFKRRTFIDHKLIDQALTKIIPVLKPEHVKIDQSLQVIVRVMAFFLHPESPPFCQARAQSHVLSMLKIIPIETIEKHCMPLLMMLVPFSALARNSDEKEKLNSCIVQGCEPIYTKEEENCVVTKQDALNQMNSLLKFILHNWNKMPEISKTLLFKVVLNTVYYDVAVAAGIKSTYGFKTPVPSDMHISVFEFIEKFIASHLDLQVIFEDPELSKFFVLVMEHSAQYPIPVCCSTALTVVTQVCQRPGLMNNLMHHTPDVIMTFIKTIGSIVFVSLVNNQLPLIVVVTVSQFLTAVFPMIYDMKGGSGMIALMRDCFDHFRAHSLVLAVLFIGFLTAVFARNDMDPEIWKFISKCVIDHDELAAANGKWAQFLVLNVFPELSGIDVKSAIEECKKLEIRRERTKQISSSDWFCNNINEIIHQPNIFVADSMPFTWVRMPFPFIIPIIDTVSMTMIDHFLGIFDSYKNEKDGVKRRRLFSCHVGFISAMISVYDMPTSIKHKSETLLEYCGSRLINGILREPDERIKLFCLQSISKIILKHDNETLLSDAVLSQWYMCIVTCLMSKDTNIVKSAVEAGVKTVQIGFTGSRIILPILLSHCESVPMVEYIPMITSISMFSADGNAPTSFKSAVIQMIKEHANEYIPNYASILNKAGSNMKQRARKMVEVLFSVLKKSGDSDIKMALPMFSSIIADELTQAKPDVQSIISILLAFCDIVEAGCDEAALLLKNILITYSDRLVGNASFRTVIDKIMSQKTDGRNEVDQLHIVDLQYQTLIHHPKDSLKYLNDFASKLHADLRSYTVSYNLKKQLTLICSDLSVRFMNYPFPNSPLFVSGKQKFYDEDSVIAAFPNGTIASVKLDGESVSVDTQIPAGHFHWDFTPVENPVSPSSAPEFTFPCLTEPSQVQKKRCSWADKFNNEFSNYEFGSCVKQKDASIESLVAQIQNTTYVASCERNPPSIPQTPSFSAMSVPQILSPEIINARTVDRTQQVCLKMKDFDTYEHRFHSKIAVVYVGRSCPTQNDILGLTMDDVSPHFKEFLHGLGWPVDLPTHHGHDGGLDMKGFSNGRDSVYYADSAYDIMYHVAPLIPTDPKDPQQIIKKRHVGNDHVHIIWNDSNRDYDVQTITSQFNQAHVIIHPLQTGLFKVDVKWKHDSGWFGPLRESTVVTKKALPALVRLTALGAMISCAEKMLPLMVPSPVVLDSLAGVSNSVTMVSLRKTLMNTVCVK